MAGKSGRSGRRCANEERSLMDLLTKSYDYLNKNFHKFDQKTKIHISLELIKRRLPMEVKYDEETQLKPTVSAIDLEERCNLYRSYERLNDPRKT